jgi:hypothetical protein
MGRKSRSPQSTLFCSGTVLRKWEYNYSLCITDTDDSRGVHVTCMGQLTHDYDFICLIRHSDLNETKRTLEISFPGDYVPKYPDHVPRYRVSMGSRHDHHGQVGS